MQRPHVIVKTAISVDGKIATKYGESQWISNPESRAYVHRLRAETDAILVGVETLLQDNPRLSARLPDQPERCGWRIIVDSRGRSSQNSTVFNDPFASKTLLATTQACDPSLLSFLKQRQIEAMVLPDRELRVDLVALMRALYDKGIRSVLVEGGGEIIASLLRLKLVDELRVAIGPMIIGGQNARSFVGGTGIEKLSDAPRLSAPKVRIYDADVILEYTVLGEE
jgi:diaminohydroxyphosphoribosylaminopyrimidine deaminase/5-amino-6-(5-phosphoribosylamino)uracil reductase